MKTNLIGVAVKTHLTSTTDETVATIRGIYRKNGYTMTILVDGKGKLYDHIPVEKLTLIMDERQWSVVLYWGINDKIKAIKAIRCITSMDLKAAKEHVEAHPNCVPIKDKLTHEEAQEIRRRISQDERMECDVRKAI
jgi:ribosomal protein L7/L12